MRLALCALAACMSVGCASRPAAHTQLWAEQTSGESLVFSRTALDTAAYAPERSRRDASLGVVSAADSARWFPEWAGAAQAPALRPWPPYGDLRGQRDWERFWRNTPRWRW